MDFGSSAVRSSGILSEAGVAAGLADVHTISAEDRLLAKSIERLDWGDRRWLGVKVVVT